MRWAKLQSMDAQGESKIINICGLRRLLHLAYVPMVINEYYYFFNLSGTPKLLKWK